ncbi:transposase [Thioalbus denitrificans]|uniref:REP element-mobilizing transposase RayT n=1 Tax=Thioalbus denitrificans TaxID=547122 RepID=A0A369BWW8_9GAMM|nr:transposase [Thioalbus denitrificans]RCX26129.1 REP element-mobilizing transposase RayT [Thioalbus denitrificans]
MTRPLRIELSGGLYHVTSRGDRREAIYFRDTDRAAWLSVFGAVCRRFNWVCHAWCQMSNHYHVVVETPEANLSGGMRQLNGVYTQYVNRAYRRVGHLFQGRYRAILVEKDAYLLELARYVVLNPVRAGMVKDAGDWGWSSYRAMLKPGSAPDWLETDWLLGQFGSTRSEAVPGYVDFVRSGAGETSPWEALRGQVFLGGEGFIERMKAALPEGDLREVPRAQRRPLARPLADYARRSDRRMAMAEAYLSGHYTMREIAEHFGVHYSTVSRAVKALESLRREARDG